MKKMRIYISGKITGLPPEEVLENFMKADRMIRKKGYDTVNPIIVVDPLSDMEWRTYMGIAYAIIHDKSIDAIYMLRNWKRSKGACMEWGWAKAAGIHVYYQDPADYRRFERLEGEK